MATRDWNNVSLLPDQDLHSYSHSFDTFIVKVPNKQNSSPPFFSLLPPPPLFSSFPLYSIFKFLCLFLQPLYASNGQYIDSGCLRKKTKSPGVRFMNYTRVCSLSVVPHYQGSQRCTFCVSSMHEDQKSPPSSLSCVWSWPSKFAREGVFTL